MTTSNARATRACAPIVRRIIVLLLIPIVLIGGGVLVYRTAYQNGYLHRQDAINNCIGAARRTVPSYLVPGEGGLTKEKIAHIAATAQTSHITATKSIVDEDAASILVELHLTKNNVRATWEVVGDMIISGLPAQSTLDRDGTFSCSVIVLNDGSVHGPTISGIERRRQ